VLKDEHMNQNRKYALIFAATMPFLALASYAAVVVCSAKLEQLPDPYGWENGLQSFPPRPKIKLTSQSRRWERAELEHELEQHIKRHLNRGHGSDQPDAEPDIQLTGGVADENTETTADGQDSSSEAKSGDDDSDSIDKWILSPKARQINRDLGID